MPQDHDETFGAAEDLGFLFDEDVPPPSDGWFDDASPTGPESGYDPGPVQPEFTAGRNAHTPLNQELAARILTTIRSCFSATHGSEGKLVIDLVRYVLGSEVVLAQLDKDQMRMFKKVGEILVTNALDDPDGEFDLFNLPDLDEVASQPIIREVNSIRAVATLGDAPENPTKVWRAMCDTVQKEAFVSSASKVISLARQDAPADELMSAFAKLEPPTTMKTIVNATFAKTAGQWEKDDAVAAAQRPAYRISSGYRTLDYVFTLKDTYGNPAELIGSWAPGEFHAIAAGTGHGKSALSRKLITAAAEDLVNGYGHEHAKVVMAITEEAPASVYKAAGLAKGQPFHHLRDNVIIADVGASRKRFVQSVWDCVIDAYHLSKATGRPIVDCGLPEFIVLDYIGGIVEAGEGGDTTAIENTANLIMRGFCGWRIQEMEQFSGESFAAYSGMSWPSGMDNFRPAVLTFVQLRKLTRPEFYDPASGHSAGDYTVENADGSPGWVPKQGDFVIPQRSEVRGSGVLQNHLTSLTIAHRSRPQTNAFVKDEVTGKKRLEDDRARLIFLKTRNSADLPFVPMRFDSNPEGFRGQYYDLLAEGAIQQGWVKPLSSYTQQGDPILPARAQRSPFAGVAY